MGFFTDLIHGRKEHPEYTGTYPPDYFGEPNVSIFTGEYSQPWFLGADSAVMGGWSPDYPKYRSYEDYFATEHPMPREEEYTYTTEDGRQVLMREAYEQALKEWSKKNPMY